MRTMYFLINVDEDDKLTVNHLLPSQRSLQNCFLMALIVKDALEIR